MNITTELFTRHFLFFLKIKLITFKRLKIILTLEWLYIIQNKNSFQNVFKAKATNTRMIKEQIKNPVQTVLLEN